jgi:hypothetical protein
MTSVSSNSQAPQRRHTNADLKKLKKGIRDRSITIGAPTEFRYVSFGLLYGALCASFLLIGLSGRLAVRCIPYFLTNNSILYRFFYFGTNALICSGM